MEKIIDYLFSQPVDYHFNQEDINTINQAIELIDNGTIRSANKVDNSWQTNQWVKKAILLYFRVTNNATVSNAPNNSFWFDRVPSKFQEWNTSEYTQAKIRALPLSLVRYGSYIAPNVIIMPSFVNIGAYVGEKTMIDSWATIGSCAQVGSNCHISADVCLGGVLEPLQATPVIVEDNCFIGAGSKILEGVIVEENSVIAAGTVISASTKIINRQTGEITYGVVPSGSVVVSGTTTSNHGVNNVALQCAVIIKQVTASTKAKTSINELLR